MTLVPTALTRNRNERLSRFDRITQRHRVDEVSYFSQTSLTLRGRAGAPRGGRGHGFRRGGRDGETCHTGY